MAKKSTRAPMRKRINHDRPTTPAERLKLIVEARKLDGEHKAIPESRLVGRHPAETIESCVYALSTLIAYGGPASPHGKLMSTIAEALEHAETVIREVGVESDFERTLRPRKAVAHG